MADKLTLFQRLGRILNRETSDRAYIFDPKAFENLDPDTLEQKKLEAKQSYYLQNQWKKIDNELYQKAVYYEPTRMASYFDYEAMEYTPEIAVSLDIFADEATTADENGKILKIYSESSRISEELTKLFEDTLDINTNLTPWARNLVKYGDNFVYTKIVPKKGIVGCVQLPNLEITRTEPGFVPARNEGNYLEAETTRFHWKDKNIEFESFEVAHFRLLGDDRKLPYGCSILEKVRRIWKQLLLAEDAMLVYRVTRAPERRVYKIYVGNMDDKDVDAYVDKIANNFKRTSIVNSQNGQQDTRYNPLAVDQDYFIPVRDPSLTMPIETLAGACISLDSEIPLMDGRCLTLRDIIAEWNGGNKILWAFSCNPETGALEPGLITWAGFTRMNTDVVKITLSNGEYVVTTPDHKFVHKTLGFVEAQHLKVGDSLALFGTSDSKILDSNTNQFLSSSEIFKSNGVAPPDTIQDVLYFDSINTGQVSCEVVSIEFLEDKMDTGTLTIDNFELFSNSHTFALKSGVFVKNSNLSEIADIEYIQRKMLAALRVHKAFIGFEETVGDGKNLAILDIRFARAVHRIQKALIQELNKIAMIHLYLKGYEDDISNFTLSLTSPSTQAELLKVQNWREKIQLYKDAVSDAGNGYGAVSMTYAKKEILGMSEDEIKLDVQRQAVERAGGEELKVLGETIKQTGMFREIYKVYSIDPNNMSVDNKGKESGGEPSLGGGGGGGFSGGGLGDVGTDFSTPFDLEGGEEGGEEGGVEGLADLGLGGEGGEGGEGGDEEGPTEEPEEEPNRNLSERVKINMEKRRKTISENMKKAIEDIDKIIKK